MCERVLMLKIGKTGLQYEQLAREQLVPCQDLAQNKMRSSVS